uniref:Si:dkey-65b12.6 n=1 Tax=Hucho hucho TaxID=62062 RepID=A0A4W5L3C1_9TELE
IIDMFCWFSVWPVYMLTSLLHNLLDPCEDTECREKENCVAMNNKAVCVAQSKATCRAVNGENVYLPVTLAGGNLTVVYSGSYAVLKTNFGLKVMYDWNMKFYITVPSSYFRTLSGLCGNYNGDHNDEFTNPKGNKEHTVVKFAQSWRTEDGDLFCHDDCQGECPSCTPALQQKYKGEKLCGLLAKKDGPFASCHKVLDPGVFMDNCVYDVCINKGIYQFLCENMKSYNDACLAEGVKISREWRTITGCPLECPSNSYYEACGTACPASCSDLDAEAKCKEPCVETCQCNKGFVLSGDKCISKESCGCSYEGRYYPSGMKFWADDKCTKQCECNPGTAKVECKATACKKSEVCGLQSGKRDCYATSYATCQGSGDPHYRTFDGKRFDFQGTCTYVLSKLVSKDDRSLAHFEVLVKNQNRGRNTAVSYTKTVTITVFKNIITMSRDNPGKVLVSYLKIQYHPSYGQLSIFRSGYFGVVKTKFGLTLKFNWNSHVSLTLPSSYSDFIGGLCGNWNGQQNDDLLKPDKSPANTPTVFGDSWKVGNDPGCSSDCDGKKCPTCDHSLMLDYQTGKYCGRITDKNGPFKHCHAKVDPREYYEDCVFDMCLYRGHASALCNALSTYTTACQDATAKVEQWRSDSFCPSSCKANSHYEVCASGCPQTCSGLDEPESCENSLCTEGCVCDEGFILSDSECVLLAECGCVHQGQYYQMGQVFFPNGQCKERCVCNKDGDVECNVKFACGPNEKCQVQDGVQACVPMSTGTCHVSGARRFHSFDGSCFSLHGDCVYKMSEVVEKDGSMAPFVVSVQQLTKMDDAMVTRRVVIQVDDVATNLPLSLGDGKVRAYQNGINIVVVTDFGLMVTYDTVAGAIIQLPSTYKGVTGGLCGNYNDKKEDDFLLPSGLQEPSVEKFAAGWLVVQEGVKCQTGCDGGLKCPPTSGPPPACSIIKSTKGPFAQCHAVVPPQEHFEECLKEGEGGDALCRHLQTYVTFCQASGGLVSSWRSDQFCPLTCPANSHYELCADTCSSTCDSLSESPKCPLCQEGCQCDDGFVFDGGKCVLLENCGCVVDGHYYKSGQSVILGNCSETCNCAAGVFTCKNSQCKEGQKCGMKNGVMDCYSTDPCEDTECREKENCVAMNNKAVCVAQSKATCRAVGDPHYLTFDGERFDFQGTCSYVMATVVKSEPGLVPFTVLTKNNHRGNKRVSFVRKVSVTVYGLTVVISTHKGKVEIDGVRSDLPVSLESGSIRITESGVQGTIQTDVGLKITFDWTAFFMVTISSSYYDNLGGICGNYNGNKADDFTTPTGVLLANTTAWVASWSVADGDPFCWHVCNGNCPTCSDTDRVLYTGPKYCGLMADGGGPFHQCHKNVPMKEFASDCLYDVCLNKGRQEVLCEALANYVAKCQQAGVVISPLWRKASNCPLACPYHSHYELCGTACPATCADPNVPEICSKVCVEGCQCDKGYVLSGEHCVVKETGCGCTHNDHYYLPEETFWEGNTCQSKCLCNGATQKVVCMPRKCKASEDCAVVNGVQDCYPLSFKTCSAQGDPHFRTFDGKRFDFQGNCIYKLAGVCSKDPDLEIFEVTLENNNRGSTRVSYAKVVTVIVLGSSYTVTGDYHGKVLVSNTGPSLTVTHFGLKVSFDWSSEVRVKVPSTYHNTICGLCGNLNDNPDDDLLLPNGKKPMSPKEFGNSYWVADVPGCSHECKDCAVVDIPIIKPKYVSACDVIVDKSGPLRDCNGRVDSDEYKEDCIYDMILNNGLLTAACDIITNYVEECQEKGGKIEAWRSKDFCHLPCPENSVYSLSASGCPATCYSMTSAPGCTTPPGEGCQCKPGFLLSDDKCVHVKNCGCHHKGRYFVTGEVFYKEENCHHRCSCNSGEMACEVAPCGPKTTCAVVKGVRGCYIITICRAVGDPHYLTFDREQFDFQVTCSYGMATVVKSEPGLIPFTVLTKNNHRGNKRVSFLRKVSVTVYGLTVVNSTHKGKVNGENVYLPVTLARGNLTVVYSGSYAVLKTNFGLKVMYDWNMKFYITVPSSYFRTLGGLCGNYNGDHNDEFTNPKGNKEHTVVKFAQSWRTEDGDLFCHDDCQGECPSCTPALQQKYKGENPFASCHKVLDPGMFMDNCVYDVCINKGIYHFLCENMESYNDVCLAEVVKMSPEWRTITGCPLECPSNSYYEVCGTAFPASCSDLDNSLRTEGCVCDDGFILSDRECVMLAECGCVHQGQYYQMGQVFFPNNQCKERCVCNKDGHVECNVKFACCPNEKCQVQDGVQACVPMSTGTCHVSGARRFPLFDGSCFSLHVDCVYKMSEVVEKDGSMAPFVLSVQQLTKMDDAMVTRRVVIQAYKYKTSMSPRVTWEIMVVFCLDLFISVLKSNT